MRKLIRPELFENFCLFSVEMLRCKDYDPNYFLVKGVCESNGFSRSDTFEYASIFNGFYHFGSAEAFFWNRNLDHLKLTFGKSRRGFRGNRKVLLFLEDLMKLKNFVLSFDRKDDLAWSILYKTILTVRGAGHWSAYYLTDLFSILFDLGLHSPNFGYLDSSSRLSGPIGGLSFLTGISVETLKGNDALHKEIFADVAHVFDGMEQMESVLCNFVSLYKGSYYIGRDIDRQLPMIDGLPEDYRIARRKYFPRSYLGEVCGWSGIRKEEMGRLYVPGRIDVRVSKS